MEIERYLKHFLFFLAGYTARMYDEGTAGLEGGGLMRPRYNLAFPEQADEMIYSMILSTLPIAMVFPEKKYTIGVEIIANYSGLQTEVNF